MISFGSLDSTRWDAPGQSLHGYMPNPLGGLAELHNLPKVAWGLQLGGLRLGPPWGAALREPYLAWL